METDWCLGMCTWCHAVPGQCSTVGDQPIDWARCKRLVNVTDLLSLSSGRFIWLFQIGNIRLHKTECGNDRAKTINQQHSTLITKGNQQKQECAVRFTILEPTDLYIKEQDSSRCNNGIIIIKILKQYLNIMKVIPLWETTLVRDHLSLQTSISHSSIYDDL